MFHRCGPHTSNPVLATDSIPLPAVMKRKLADSGTSNQRLLDAVRQQAARELLATTGLANGETAFLLGFEELNSFHRAFSAWEGTTPLRWRQRAAVTGTGRAG